MAVEEQLQRTLFFVDVSTGVPQACSGIYNQNAECANFDTLMNSGLQEFNNKTSVVTMGTLWMIHADTCRGSERQDPSLSKPVRLCTLGDTFGLTSRRLPTK